MINDFVACVAEAFFPLFFIADFAGIFEKSRIFELFGKRGEFGDVGVVGGEEEFFAVENGGVVTNFIISLARTDEAITCSY
ncbi:hypothetical protein [Thiothrix litoralis]|uniref:hypothetical protein n=1 Tax=Thiothrix litoralis TaxID=2891210 RepID=UPI001D180F57|nr:hypothetical protein [Thiothrix litoralis]